MDNTCQSELINTIEKLTQKLNNLKIHHDYLSNIRCKLSSLVNKDELSICSQLYNSECTMAVNDPSFISRSATDDLFSEIMADNIADDHALRISNTNCSEDLFKYELTNEKFQQIIDEESIETPFVISKNKDYVFNEGIDNLEIFLDILRVLIFVQVHELLECLDIDCLNFVQLNFSPNFCCPSLDSSSDRLLNYYAIKVSYQRKMIKEFPKKVDLFEKKSIQEDVQKCRTSFIYTSTDFTKAYVAKTDSNVDVAQRSSCGPNPYYRQSHLIGNHIAYLKYRNNIDRTISTINNCYTPCQSWTHKSGHLTIKKSLKRSKLYTNIVQSQTSKYKSSKLNTLDNICVHESLIPPKRLRNKYSYHYSDYCENLKNIDNCELTSDKSKKKLWKSTAIASESKDRSFTVSERLWHKTIKASMMKIFRKVLVEMFSNNTHTKPQMMPLIISDQSKSDSVAKIVEIADIAVEKPTEESEDNNIPIDQHQSTFIKLNSIDIIEQRLTHFNLLNSQIPQCKTIFDMKKAIRSNIMNDTTRTEGDFNFDLSYFAENQAEKTKEATDDSLKFGKGTSIFNDSFSDSTATLMPSDETSQTLMKFHKRYQEQKKHIPKEKSELLFSESIDLDYLPATLIADRHTRFEDHESLVQCFSSSSGKEFVTERNNQSSLCESLNKSVTESTFKDSTRSKSSDSQNRYFGRSKEALFDSLLDESIADTEGFRPKSLREKAVAHILNGKANPTCVRSPLKSTTSAHIDRFIGTQNVASLINKYCCSQCSMTFRLAAERRQHWRRQHYGHGK